MSGVTPEPPGKMTVAEFLDWAAREDVGRVELVDGEVVAMAGERVAHARVSKNVERAIDAALASIGSHCEAFRNSLAVQVDASTAFIPDVAVDCGDLSDADRMIMDQPTIVVEVLSASTGYRDRGAKVTGYFLVPSIAHYLLVDLDGRRVIHHKRAGDEFRTRLYFVNGEIDLDPPGLSIDIEDFWRGLPPQPAA